MEKIKEESVRLQREILPDIERSIENYVLSAICFKKEQQNKLENEIEILQDKLDRVKLGIEVDNAAISFIKSQLQSSEYEKENSPCPKKILHQKVEKSRDFASELSNNVRLYEKRLGLSLKKLCDDTLWIAFQYITPVESEHSTVVKVESGIYVLVNCTPALENINFLIQSLNTNNNFSKFIRELRKSFVSLYREL